MTGKRTLAAFIAAGAMLAPAAILADAGHGVDIGNPGDPKQVARTIEIVSGDDFRYRPSQIAVKRGETVRLVVKNPGRIDHELVLGSMDDLKAHAQMMRKHPGMEHDAPNQAMVRPGEARAIVWQFTRAGTVGFACTIPGHLEAGMVGEVQVRTR
ncbi:MAG: cupredoxin family protein [Burkholderiales bacterium]|nr:cupredoxin family protein [Burkholderiales bacterium]